MGQVHALQELGQAVAISLSGGRLLLGQVLGRVCSGRPQSQAARCAGETGQGRTAGVSPAAATAARHNLLSPPLSKAESSTLTVGESEPSLDAGSWLFCRPGGDDEPLCEQLSRVAALELEVRLLPCDADAALMPPRLFLLSVWSFTALLLYGTPSLRDSRDCAHSDTLIRKMRSTAYRANSAPATM